MVRLAAKRNGSPTHSTCSVGYLASEMVIRAASKATAAVLTFEKILAVEVVTIEISHLHVLDKCSSNEKSWKVLILLGLISSFSLFLWVNEQNLLRPKFTHSIRFSTENLKIVRDYSKILDDAWVVTADSKGTTYTSGNNYMPHLIPT